MKKSSHTPVSSPAQLAVRQANSALDYGVAALTTAICLLIVVVIAVFAFIGAISQDVPGYYGGETPLDQFFGSVFVWGLGAVFILIIILVTTRMMRQMYLGNALQVEYSDYAWLRDWSNKVAEDLQMPRVEIMITQDPVMNAFAFGFAKPYTIVLNSGSIRWLTHEQLKVIVVHEMAHVKYRHTQIGTYLSVLRSMPVVGGLFSWILDFWSRRIELTSDRLALCYLRDKKLVKEALIRVHVGPDVANSFNDIAEQWQVYMTRSGFQSFTQTFSSHPFLVKRLQHLDRMQERYAPTWRPAPEAETTHHAATQ